MRQVQLFLVLPGRFILPLLSRRIMSCKPVHNQLGACVISEGDHTGHPEVQFVCSALECAHHLYAHPCSTGLLLRPSACETQQSVMVLTASWRHWIGGQHLAARLNEGDAGAGDRAVAAADEVPGDVVALGVQVAHQVVLVHLGGAILPPAGRCLIVMGSCQATSASQAWLASQCCSRPSQPLADPRRMWPHVLPFGRTDD